MNQLFVVGIGPGKMKNLTIEAKEVLEDCEIIVGYHVYIALVKKYLPNKQYIETGMTQEETRCKMALEEAAAGRKTAVVCSGDAGVYGMAGIILEMSVGYPDVEIQVVAGVSAALAGGAVLGAPLGHDFAVISLSDFLISWDKIEQRLQGAAMADFVICLYNPSSNRRKDYLQKACNIIRNYKSDDTVCGYVENIGRDGEQFTILSLQELEHVTVTMFTTVFIGNSQTRKIGNHMVTPRGYQLAETRTECRQL